MSTTTAHISHAPAPTDGPSKWVSLAQQIAMIAYHLRLTNTKSTVLDVIDNACKQFGVDASQPLYVKAALCYDALYACPEVEHLKSSVKKGTMAQTTRPSTSSTSNANGKARVQQWQRERAQAAATMSFSDLNKAAMPMIELEMPALDRFELQRRVSKSGGSSAKMAQIKRHDSFARELRETGSAASKGHPSPVLRNNSSRTSPRPLATLQVAVCV